MLRNAPCGEAPLRAITSVPRGKMGTQSDFLGCRHRYSLRSFSNLKETHSPFPCIAKTHRSGNATIVSQSLALLPLSSPQLHVL